MPRLLPFVVRMNRPPTWLNALRPPAFVPLGALGAVGVLPIPPGVFIRPRYTPAELARFASLRARLRTTRTPPEKVLQQPRTRQPAGAPGPTPEALTWDLLVDDRLLPGDPAARIAAVTQLLDRTGLFPSVVLVAPQLPVSAPGGRAEDAGRPAPLGAGVKALRAIVGPAALGAGVRVAILDLRWPHLARVDGYAREPAPDSPVQVWARGVAPVDLLTPDGQPVTGPREGDLGHGLAAWSVLAADPAAYQAAVHDEASDPTAAQAFLSASPPIDGLVPGATFLLYEHPAAPPTVDPLLAASVMADPATGSVVVPAAAARPADAAIVGACLELSPGDVLLLEIGLGAEADYPIECDRLAAAAIRMATQLGVLVVEPSGNRSHDTGTPPIVGLRGTSDAFVWYDAEGEPVTDDDSGAILTTAVEAPWSNAVGGAATTTVPRGAAGRGWGARVDAWGPDAARVSGLPPTEPLGVASQSWVFEGTSAAAAVVAGTLTALQALFLRRAPGHALNPGWVRGAVQRTVQDGPPTVPAQRRPDRWPIAADGAGLGRGIDALAWAAHLDLLPALAPVDAPANAAYGLRATTAIRLVSRRGFDDWFVQGSTTLPADLPIEATQDATSRFHYVLLDLVERRGVGSGAFSVQFYEVPRALAPPPKEAPSPGDWLPLGEPVRVPSHPGDGPLTVLAPVVLDRDPATTAIVAVWWLDAALDLDHRRLGYGAGTWLPPDPTTGLTHPWSAAFRADWTGGIFARKP